MSEGEHTLPDRRHLVIRAWLSGIVGVLIACPLALELESDVASPYVAGVVILGANPLFALSLILLTCVAWRAVVVHHLPKMEVWWWLSVPYTVLFALCYRLFRWDRVVWHVYVLFALVYMATAASTAVWTLAALYQLVVSRQSTVWKCAMLVVALTLPIIVWTMWNAVPGVL